MLNKVPIHKMPDREIECMLVNGISHNYPRRRILKIKLFKVKISISWCIRSGQAGRYFERSTVAGRAGFVETIEYASDPLFALFARNSHTFFIYSPD